MMNLELGVYSIWTKEGSLYFHVQEVTLDAYAVITGVWGVQIEHPHKSNETSDRIDISKWIGKSFRTFIPFHAIERLVALPGEILEEPDA